MASPTNNNTPVDPSTLVPPPASSTPPPTAPDASSSSNSSAPAPSGPTASRWQITAARRAQIKKFAIGVIALLVVAAIGYGVHKTIGWQAVGERLSQLKERSFAWLNSPSNLSNGKSLLFIGVPGIAAGAGLTVGGKKAYAKYQTWQANRRTA